MVNHRERPDGDKPLWRRQGSRCQSISFLPGRTTTNFVSSKRLWAPPAGRGWLPGEARAYLKPPGFRLAQEFFSLPDAPPVGIYEGTSLI